MKKFKIEYLLYTLIIISPILDAVSFLLKGLSVSPTLILRPIIPGILLIYIFIKDKNSRKLLGIGAFAYILYGIIHLIITRGNLTQISYGSLFQEMQYVFNYTYMVFILYILMWFKKKTNLSFLNKSLLITLGIYLAIIYISILTGTSTSTYLTGIGYKSYFISGNSLCTILIMLVANTLTNMNKKSYINLILYVLSGIFLIKLVGTRTGLFGFSLITIVYIILLLYNKYKSKINKKVVIGMVLIGIILMTTIVFAGSKLLARRQEMNEEAKIIDVNTGHIGHTTGDTAKFIEYIKHAEVVTKLTDVEKHTYLDMYHLANKLKLKANNTRAQQLIYNSYRVLNEHNIISILFGNGYITNYGEMILEMEIPAIILNFGIFGFLLYIMPFLYALYKVFKVRDKSNINSIFYIFSVVLTIILGSIAGYVFYSGTCMLITSSLLTKSLKED